MIFFMQKDILVQKSLFIQENKGNIRDYYEIQEKEIASGAFGKVFLAKKKAKPSVLRAVKVIGKSFGNTQRASEALLLKVLDHPNILKLYEIFEDPSNVYLVTDYFEGGDLFQRLEEKGVCSEQEAKQIFKQTLEAIAYCHTQKIAHRDIKPENIMFLTKKTLSLKLIDFGLAQKWVQNLKQENRKGKKIIGSIYYVSPELIAGNYDERCDIWSLGVLLYVMVTAQFPFDGQTEKQISQNIKNARMTTQISKLSISNQLKDILTKLLSKQALRPKASDIFNHPWLVSKQNAPLIKLNFSKLANFSKFSKVKTLAVTYIASQLPQKDIQRLGNLFRQLDINHDGFLSIQELKTAFQKQKQKSSLSELSKMLQFIDTDKNGQINYTQFISCCLENSTIFRQDNLKAAFRLLDRDQNGKIQKKQLLQLLKESNINISSEAIEEMIRACDKNKDGYIDYKEFVENISKH